MPRQPPENFGHRKGAVDYYLQNATDYRDRQTLMSRLTPTIKKEGKPCVYLLFLIDQNSGAARTPCPLPPNQVTTRSVTTTPSLLTLGKIRKFYLFTAF